MMLGSRWTAAAELPVTTKPPFDSRANAATSRSISSASRTSIGLNSTPNDGGAMAWIGELADPGGHCGIAKDGNSRQVGRNLFE